ncbi:MAG TPA: hypothetical protein VLZ72_00240 [Flavobacterium sp.]|nr:hypothetical protein [Flavobacterium sp.]
MQAKKKLFLLLPFCFLSFAYAQPSLPKTDSLIGNIKSVREKLIFLNDTIQNVKLFYTEGEYGHHGFTSREFTLGRFEKWWYTMPWTHYTNYYREYDKNQNITLETWYYKDDSFLEEYRFKYDKNNNLIERQEYWDKDTLSEITRFSYDYQNLKTSMIRFYPDDNEYYQYENYENDNKLLVKHSQFNQEGYQITFKYKYNKSKKKLSEDTYSPFSYKPIKDGKSFSKTRDSIDNLLHKTIFLYDDLGNLIQKENYSSDNVRNEYKLKKGVRPIFEYDSLNRLYKTIFLNSEDNVISEHIYEYFNETNLPRKESDYSFLFPETNSKTEYFYDIEHNLIKLVATNKKGINIAEFQYKFDENGNWYEQLKTVNGMPLYLRKREIVYY